MSQRSDTVRSITLIVGSAFAAVCLTTFVIMAKEKPAEQPTPPTEVTTVVVELSELRLNQEFFERTRAVAEAMAQHEKAVAEATAKNGDQSSDLEALQVRLQAELAALRAQLEALESSRRDLEGAIVRANGGESGAAPVIYVDGVRFDGPAENLDPEDIESVEVIKGDAAIAKYGKEGENGVIIVKKRKPGKKRKGGGRR